MKRIILFFIFCGFAFGTVAVKSQAVRSPSPIVYSPETTTAIIAEYDRKILDLEYQLRDLTGKMQLMEHQLRQMQDHISLYVEKTALRMKNIEEMQLIPPSEERVVSVKPPKTKGGQLSSQPQKLTKAAKKQPISELEKSQIQLDSQATENTSTVFELKPKNPAQVKQQYDYARSFLLSKEYDIAEQALNEFIKIHPEHDLSGNAMYWLGETFYVRNNYKKASQTFSQAFQTFPKSKKAPDILLKLAMSLTALNKNTEACQTYKKVLELFPKSNRNILVHARKAISRNGCQ